MSTTFCPSWCREHYTVDSTRNHASAPRTVCGFDADTAEPSTVAVWVELRHDKHGDAHIVGVLEKQCRNDVELSSYQMRELAAHILAVAELVEKTELPATEQGGTS